jgi:hypothetical protein
MAEADHFQKLAEFDEHLLVASGQQKLGGGMPTLAWA